MFSTSHAQIAPRVQYPTTVNSRMVTLFTARCWETITPLPAGRSAPLLMPRASPMSSNKEINFAYALWAERLIDEGWTPYLLTFMFRDLGGPPYEVARTMEREVERVYATVLTRIVRNPTRPSMIGKFPVWFCALDRPVFKRAKQSLSDVVVNDGLHVHAVAFVLPWSRMSEDLAAHFEKFRGLYLRSESPLIRIDVVPITHRVSHVVDYIRKYIVRNGEYAGFVLPRALSEVRDRAT